MKTLDHSSIKALISLLEDPSEVIFNEINQTIVALGDRGISHLQTALNESDSDLQKKRIIKILDALKLNKLNKDLKNWRSFNTNDLLEGLILIAHYGFPDLDDEMIEKTIKNIADNLKDKIKGKSNKEIVHLLNQVILYDFSFNGNMNNYSGINNSFINKIIENKISNPIGLSIIYLLVVQKLNIPLVGINSPGHFILGIAKDNLSKDDIILETAMDEIDFFIDPFNNGALVSHEDFDNMLLQIPYPLENKKLLVATNVDIIKRVMNNLIYAIFISGKKDTAKELLEIAEAI